MKKASKVYLLLFKEGMCTYQGGYKFLELANQDYEFKLNGGIKYLHKNQQQSHRPKTLEAISWMDQYFKRIGNKRPDGDHDGIYLPTCLTEMKIYEIMLEELYSGKEGCGICYSKVLFYLLGRVQKCYHSQG